MKNYCIFPCLAAIVLLAVACVASPTPAPPTPTASPAATATHIAPTPSPSPTSTPAPTETPVPRAKVLRIGHLTYPGILDPQKAFARMDTQVLRLVYEGLLSLDAKGNVGPGAADKWERKPGNQMTFSIRDGLKRFDGTSLTAQDYAYALRRALDPRVPDRQNASLLYDIKGARELDALDAKAKPEEIDKALANLGVKAADDKTLVVTFKQPVGAYWQTIAATVVTFPSEKKQVDRDPDKWWDKPENHNGNGPFMIQAIEPGKKIVLVSNPNYWRGKPKLDRIELIFYPSTKEILEAYKKGEVDIDASIGPDDLAEIDADATLKSEFLRYPAAITWAIGFNTARKPFDDKNVRIAFSQAFDREGYIRDVLRGVGKPYTRWIAPGSPGAQADKPGVPAYDPKAAVKTLVNNGYGTKDSTADKPRVDCARLGEIKVTYPATAFNQIRFQFLLGNFFDVFGCLLTLDPVEPGTFAALPKDGVLSLSKDVKSQPLLSRQGWIEDYPHPQNWLSTYWTCSSPYAQRYGYCNKDLDALLSKADQEPDLKKSIQLYQQAEDILMKDVPAVFSHYGENLYLVKPYVLGLREHIGSGDTEWAGQWGPVWLYDIDLMQVPAK